MYISYKSVTTKEKIGIKQGKEIMISKKTKLLNNLSRFLIITLPISYNNNMLYFLSIHESNIVSVLDKKKKNFVPNQQSKTFEAKLYVKNTAKRKNTRQKACFYICRLAALMRILKFGS